MLLLTFPGLLPSIPYL